MDLIKFFCFRISFFVIIKFAMPLKLSQIILWTVYLWNCFQKIYRFLHWKIFLSLSDKNIEKSKCWAILFFLNFSFNLLLTLLLCFFLLILELIVCENFLDFYVYSLRALINPFFHKFFPHFVYFMSIIFCFCMSSIAFLGNFADLQCSKNQDYL